MATKAVLLDRDGVIIRERGAYTFLPAHIQHVPGIEVFLKALQDADYRLIVVSNQGGIAKGLYGHDDVALIHQLIADHLAEYGVSIADWFYCPHHETVGRCLCRKPSPLMIERALARHQIAPEQAYLIGDQESDTEAAQRAGIQALPVPSNTDLSLYPPITGVL